MKNSKCTDQKVYIITGLSGSGKSTAIEAFEDAFFYCIDNMPIELLPKFFELCLKKESDSKGLAFVMDIRSKDFISRYASGIRFIKKLKKVPTIIFLEASVDTLLKRFSQTRRHHPLYYEKNILKSIELEKKIMLSIKKDAHHVIDTTHYNVHMLKSEILNLIHNENTEANLMQTNILSFGFKYGIPKHADIVIDMRFLTNPYFVPELKDRDGESDKVKNFVLSNDETKIFLKKYLDLLDYLIPLYKKETKAYLTIAVGCTGGRHRSVVIANRIFDHLNKKGLEPDLIHRDITKDIKET